MRKFTNILSLVCLSCISVFGFVRDKNVKPEIFGQKQLSINQGQSITVQLTDLYVIDWDNTYPNDFTLEVFGGNNYSLSGNTVTPFKTFYGTLKVEVRVNDGEDNSRKYDLTIRVNQVLNQTPSITGQVPININQNQSVTIQFSHITVFDTDNSYPTDFTLNVNAGFNYTVSNSTTITPDPFFTGTLSVPITVNDGQNSSPVYNLKIQVAPVNNIPKIVGQVLLRTNEDETLSIQLSHLLVNDSDDSYPTGFKLTVMDGKNYTLSENNVNPLPNFNGTLTIPVTVNDGTDESAPFNLSVIVTPVNDLPLVTTESEPLIYKIGSGPSFLTPLSTVVDVDDDTLTLAEIKFDKETYRIGKDQLTFTNTQNIRGVFDTNEGILSLIGRASVMEYQEALQVIQYNYTAPKDDSLYSLKTISIKVTDGRNSSAPAQREISLGDTFADLDIPTGFTPNGDLVNDTWSVKPLHTDGISNPVIRVYNKRGMVVYEATDFNNAWDGIFDGEFLPSDTYFYTIDLNLPNKKAKFNGLVTILR